MTKIFGTSVLGAALAVGLHTGALADVDNGHLALPHEETIEGNVFAARCDVTGSLPAVRLKIHDLRDDKGSIRVQLYNDDPEAFLAKGTKLLRIEVPAPTDGENADICIPLETAGTYAIFVMHDRDGDGKADVFSEGFGISNNPKLKLRKPRHDEAAFNIGDEILDMDINMQYFGGNNRRRRR